MGRGVCLQLLLLSEVELRSEENCCCLQDVVGSLEFTILFVRPLQLISLLGGETGPINCIYFGLPRIGTQRLGTYAKLMSYT